MSLITQPAIQMPLVLRSLGRESTVQQAAGFGRIASPDTIDRITKAMFAAFAAETGPATGTRPGSVDGVLLREPDMRRAARAVGDEAGRLRPEAILTLLVGRLQSALGATTLDTLRNRLAFNQAQQLARALQGQALSAALQAALDDAIAAQEGADAAAAEAGAAQGGVDAARADVQRLQDELDAMQPDDPARAGLDTQLAAARQRLQAAEAQLQDKAGAALAAAAVLDRALHGLETLRLQADDFNRGQPQGIAVEKPQRAASAKLQELIARLSQVMSDFSLEKLKSESEALMEQLKAREAENLQRARKQEDEQARAEAAQKKTGCIGKVFKWVGAAVAAVASAVVVAVGLLTANPMLVVAGIIGLAMTIDSMVGLATGHSAMGSVIETVGNAVASALVAVGVSEQLARQIGMIVATIAVVVASMAVSIASGNIGGAVQSINQAAMIAKQVAEVVEVVGQLAGMVGQLTENIGHIIVANIMIGVAELLAAIENSLFGSEVLRELLGKVRDAAADLDRTALDLMQRMSDVIHDDSRTARHVLSLIRTTA